MSEFIAGGWSPYKELTSEAKEVFSHGIEHFVGVDYSPLLFARQVVNGENYAFFCNASIPGSSVTYPAMVTIHQNMQRNVGITHIERLNY